MTVVLVLLSAAVFPDAAVVFTDSADGFTVDSAEESLLTGVPDVSEPVVSVLEAFSV